MATKKKKKRTERASTKRRRHKSERAWGRTNRHFEAFWAPKHLYLGTRFTRGFDSWFAPRDRRCRCVWLRDVSVSHGQLRSALTVFKDEQSRTLTFIKDEQTNNVSININTCHKFERKKVTIIRVVSLPEFTVHVVCGRIALILPLTLEPGKSVAPL